MIMGLDDDLYIRLYCIDLRFCNCVCREYDEKRYFMFIETLYGHKHVLNWCSVQNTYFILPYKYAVSNNLLYNCSMLLDSLFFMDMILRMDKDLLQKHDLTSASLI